MEVCLNLCLPMLTPTMLRATLNAGSKRAAAKRGKAVTCLQELEREISGFLMQDRTEKARIKAEIYVYNSKQELAFDIIETVCQLLSARAGFIDNSETVPADLEEQYACLDFCSDKMDVEEFLTVKKMFTRKFGSKALKMLIEKQAESQLVKKMEALLSLQPPKTEEIDTVIDEIRRRLSDNGPNGGSGGAPFGGSSGGGIPKPNVRIPELPKVPGAPPKMIDLSDLGTVETKPEPVKNGEPASSKSSPAAPAPGPSSTPPVNEDLLARLNRLKK
jgi:Regulator of Vps4 activity in the MVB pathway